MDPFTMALLGSTATSALGGLLGSRASSRAAGEQSQASMMSALMQAQQAQAARQAQEQYYQQAKEAYAPYTQFGEQSTNRLASLLGVGGDKSAAGYGSMMTPFTGADITADPIYQTMLEQGLKTSARQMAARGGQGYLSGSAVRGAEGVASLEGQNAYNRFMDQRQRQYNMLSGGVGTGLSAAGGVAGAATGTGANIANTLLGSGQAMGQGIEQAGQARASGYMGGATALQGALSSVPQNAMLYGMMNRFAPDGGTPDAAPAGYVRFNPNMGPPMPGRY